MTMYYLLPGNYIIHQFNTASIAIYITLLSCIIELTERKVLFCKWDIKLPVKVADKTDSLMDESA